MCQDSVMSGGQDHNNGGKYLGIAVAAAGLIGLPFAIFGPIGDWFEDSSEGTAQPQISSPPTQAPVQAPERITVTESAPNGGYSPPPAAGITTTYRPPAPQVSDPEPPAVAAPPSTVDRIKITTFAYNEVGPNTYTANNIGGKEIDVYWSSYAAGRELTSGCWSTVTIEGPGTYQTKDLKGCDSNNPGTRLNAEAVGTHTITVTVRQSDGSQFSDSITVTIV